MSSSAAVRSSTLPLFFGFAALVAATGTALLQLHALNPAVDVLAWAVTVDVAIGIPALYWFVVLRRGHARPITVVPIFLLSVGLARLILPAGQTAFVASLSLLIVPAEIFLAVYLLDKLRRVSSTSGDTEWIERLRQGVEETIGKGRSAALIHTEMAMIILAFAGWWMQPHRVAEMRAVTFYRRSGWGGILFGLGVILVAEAIALHLFLSMWSTTLAWVVTALGMYSVLWLVGDYHALRLRPMLLGADGIKARWGLRWEVNVAVEEIAAVRRLTGEVEKRPGRLRFAAIEEPDYLIVLRHPALARGLFGMTREVSEIALLPDDAAPLEELMTRISSAPPDESLTPLKDGSAPATRPS